MNSPHRRRLLHHGLQGALACTIGVAIAPARAAAARPVLALAHTHTGERAEFPVALDDGADAAVQAALDRFLRDHRSGEVGAIDPRLPQLLVALQRSLGARGAFEVISGFRSAATNERLRRSGGGGVAVRSLHLEGRAIDVRLPGVPLAELRDAALGLARGGVGFYAREDFVHLDTGRVRRW